MNAPHTYNQLSLRVTLERSASPPTSHLSPLRRQAQTHRRLMKHKLQAHSFYHRSGRLPSPSTPVKYGPLSSLPAGLRLPCAGQSPQVLAWRSPRCNTVERCHVPQRHLPSSLMLDSSDPERGEVCTLLVYHILYMHGLTMHEPWSCRLHSL